MTRVTESVSAIRAGACVICAAALTVFAGQARGSDSNEGGYSIGQPYINGGLVCVVITNTTAGDLTMDLCYKRAELFSLLTGPLPANDSRVEEAQRRNGQMVPGNGSAMFCFTPSAAGNWCNGFEVKAAGTNNVIACRAISYLTIPKSNGINSTSNVSLGNQTFAPAGATSVILTVSGALPPGWSVNVPPSVSIPPSGLGSIPVTVTHPAGVADPVTFTVSARFNNFNDPFDQLVFTVTSGAIPTVSEWGLITMGLLMLSAGTIAMRFWAARSPMPIGA